MLSSLLNFAKNVGKGSSKEMYLDETNLLASYIPNHRIQVKNRPFRYVVVDNFFTDEHHEALRREFQAVLDQKRFHSFGERYDASAYTPKPGTNEFPSDVMRTPEWLRYFATLFELEITNDEIMSFHHHTVGSASGGRHNDYIACSFRDDPLPNGVNSWYNQCVYEDSSSTSQPGTRQVMRAITIIYYVNNECGGKFGGETGIYDGERLVDTVAPVNNRLLAFEVSPDSFHTFLSNTKYERNSITQWMHQEQELMRTRFNNAEPVRW